MDCNKAFCQRGNTLGTVVSDRQLLHLLLAADLLELRRLMIVRGERDAIFQDRGFRGFGAMGRVRGQSKSRSWTFLAILPSSSMSACRKAVFTSSWRTSQSISAAIASTVRTLCSLQTGAKVLPQSCPGTWLQPCATLYVRFAFTIETQMVPMTFQPGGTVDRGTSL